MDRKDWILSERGYANFSLGMVRGRDWRVCGSKMVSLYDYFSSRGCHPAFACVLCRATSRKNLQKSIWLGVVDLGAAAVSVSLVSTVFSCLGIDVGVLLGDGPEPSHLFRSAGGGLTPDHAGTLTALNFLFDIATTLISTSSSNGW